MGRFCKDRCAGPTARNVEELKGILAHFSFILFKFPQIISMHGAVLKIFGSGSTCVSFILFIEVERRRRMCVLRGTRSVFHIPKL
jgi:hypothetical protein